MTFQVMFETEKTIGPTGFPLYKTEKEALAAVNKNAVERYLKYGWMLFYMPYEHVLEYYP